MLTDNLRKAICLLKCEHGHTHGIIHLQELSYEGPVYIHVFIENLSPGAHGFHIHQSGDSSQGAKSLCAHYNPFGKAHGDLNDPDAHLGDLGNIYANEDEIVETEFIAEYVRLRGEYSVIGRSFVVHEDEDDLGRGDFSDSKTTGHSGERVLWGVIGINEDC